MKPLLIFKLSHNISIIMFNFLHIIPLFLLFIGISCTPTHKSVGVYLFSPGSPCQEENDFSSYMDTAHLSNWSMENMNRLINDTLFHISLDMKRKNICVYNHTSHHVSRIPLDRIPKLPIYSIYYHNHDSVFLFFDLRAYVDTTNPDFVMINKDGGIVDTYSLNDIPYIYRGSYHNSIFYSNDKMQDRIVDGKLLIPFAFADLNVLQPVSDFINLPLMGLYDLQHHTCRMLNIRYPQEKIGKRYVRDLVTTAVHATWQRNEMRQLIVSFTNSPNIYCYDFEKDSLFLTDDCDCIFHNTDSASMKPDSNYSTFKFWNPEWHSESNIYTRTIQLYANGMFGRTRIVQLLDSNLRSLGYLCENKHFYTPYYSNGSWRAQSKDDNLIYEVSLSEKTVICPVDEFMKKYKPAATVLPDGKTPVNVFFKNLGIPIKNNNIILIININYPCGHCLEYLLDEMRQHQNEYEAHGVYFVLLERAGENYADILLRKYGLENAANVIVDRRHYPSVILNGKGIDDENYRFFLITDKGVIARTSSSAKMPTDFKELIKNEVFNSKTNNNE